MSCRTDIFHGTTSLSCFICDRRKQKTRRMDTVGMSRCQSEAEKKGAIGLALSLAFCGGFNAVMNRASEFYGALPVTRKSFLGVMFVSAAVAVAFEKEKTECHRRRVLELEREERKARASR